MKHNKNLGGLGENAACGYLTDNGYKILRRNYRKRYGEVDIIAENNGCLIFIEVKTRKNDGYGEPSEAVGYVKLERIKKVAAAYLAELSEEREVRIDVVEVYAEFAAGRFLVREINHIKNVTGW